MLKVLIVDNNDDDRKSLAHGFDWIASGFVLAGEAKDGREGLEKILTLKPDLVISEVNTPKLNGLDMISKGKDELIFETIIITDSHSFEDALQALRLKIYDYLLKPLDISYFKDVIQELASVIKNNKRKDFLFKQDKEGANIKLLACTNDYKNKHVKIVIEIISNKYMEKLSLEKIAKEINIGPSYLSKKFKEEVGINYLDFLNQYRIQKAIDFLDEGVFKIYEISNMSGFTDYKHFSNVFKKYIGVPPSKFVKSKSIK